MWTILGKYLARIDVQTNKQERAVVALQNDVCAILENGWHKNHQALITSLKSFNQKLPGKIYKDCIQQIKYFINSPDFLTFPDAKKRFRKFGEGEEGKQDSSIYTFLSYFGCSYVGETKEFSNLNTNLNTLLTTANEKIEKEEEQAPKNTYYEKHNVSSLLTKLALILFTKIICVNSSTSSVTDVALSDQQQALLKVPQSNLEFTPTTPYWLEQIPLPLPLSPSLETTATADKETPSDSHQTDSAENLPPNPKNHKLQLYPDNKNGTDSNIFLVSEGGYGAQTQPRLVTDATTGTTWITWNCYDLQSNNYYLCGRAIDSAGNFLTPAKFLWKPSDGFATDYNVGRLTNGGYFIVYCQTSAGTDYVMLKKFDSTFTADANPPTVIDSGTRPFCLYPSTVSLANGDYGAQWYRQNAQDSTSIARSSFKMYDSNGNPRMLTKDMGPSSDYWRVFVDHVTLLQDNSIAVTYSVCDKYARGKVYFNRYDNAGNILNGPFLVTTGVGSTLTGEKPNIALLDNGNLVIVYRGETASYAQVIQARLATATGLLLADAVNLTPIQTYNPLLLSPTKGGYVVTLQDDSKSPAQWQSFEVSNNGSLVGNAVTMPASTVSSCKTFTDQCIFGTSVSASPRDLLLPVWQDGSNYPNIYAASFRNNQPAPIVRKTITAPQALDHDVDSLDFTIPVNEVFSYPGMSSDLTYSASFASSLNSWLKFDSQTQRLYSTKSPDKASVGTWPITITATAKTGGGAASTTFSLTVINYRPTVTAAYLAITPQQTTPLNKKNVWAEDKDDKNDIVSITFNTENGQVERVDQPGLAVNRVFLTDIANSDLPGQGLLFRPDWTAINSGQLAKIYLWANDNSNTTVDPSERIKATIEVIKNDSSSNSSSPSIWWISLVTLPAGALLTLLVMCYKDRRSSQNLRKSYPLLCKINDSINILNVGPLTSENGMNLIRLIEGNFDPNCSLVTKGLKQYLEEDQKVTVEGNLDNLIRPLVAALEMEANSDGLTYSSRCNFNCSKHPQIPFNFFKKHDHLRNVAKQTRANLQSLIGLNDDTPEASFGDIKMQVVKEETVSASPSSTNSSATIAALSSPLLTVNTA
jgi:hypothetical protein